MDTFIVYCITEIDTNLPIVMIVGDPIVLKKRYATFAQKLLRRGEREFKWEESGVLTSAQDARECKEKWIERLVSGPQSELTAIIPMGRPKIPANENTPRFCTESSRRRFLAAARDLCRERRATRKEYLETYVPPEVKGPARKTDGEKMLTRMKRNWRYRNKLRLEVKQRLADMVWEANE